MDSVYDKARAEHGRNFCRRCVDRGTIAQGWDRYSMQVFAGTYCDDCWEKDGRNHDRQLDWWDAGEVMDPDEY